MRSNSVALLASLVLVPSLLGCASSGPVASFSRPVAVPLALESSVPTRVFVEVAGTEPTPPSVCDDVVANRAFDETSWGDTETLRPACESACRVDTCQALVIEAQVKALTYDDELERALPQLIGHCVQSVDACLAVADVAMYEGRLDELGLVLPEYEYEEVFVAETDPDDEDDDDEDYDDDDYDDYDGYGTYFASAPALAPELVSACEAGDAAACYSLVDPKAVAMGWNTEPHAVYESSLAYWEQACKLDARVYCRGLTLALDYGQEDEGCGG